MIVRLREWRERRGLTVRKLAELAGVSYVTIVNVEGGRMSPTVGLLEKLAKPLGISVRDFFPIERKGHTSRRTAR